MRDGSTQEIQGKSLQVERRSPERLRMEQSLRAHEAWLESLDVRVQNGILTEKEKRRLIALALLRKEQRTKREQKKNEIEPMTELYRQEHLRSTLEEKIAQGKPFGLLFTDLDGFGEINKLYGQPAGDEVIIQAALRITEKLRGGNGRSEDIPFRNGGDEVAIILPGVDNLENLKLIAERIRISMESAPFHIPFSYKQVPLTVSVGGVIWNGGTTTNELLHKVGQQLVEAKKERNTTQI